MMTPKDYADLHEAIIKWFEDSCENYDAYNDEHLVANMARAAECVFNAWQASQACLKANDEE